MPLPLDGDGLPVFGGGLNDHPDVAATLRAAGLPPALNEQATALAARGFPRTFPA